MGCDIHAYIEFYDPTDNMCIDYGAECFSSGELYFGRDYNLFGALAGVRSSGTPHIVPKGIPDAPKISWTCAGAYYMLVDDGDNKSKPFIPYERTITSKEVEELKKNRWVQEIKIDGHTIINNPDYHSAGWLSLSELLDVRKVYLLEQAEFWVDMPSKKRKQLIKFIQEKTPTELVDYVFHGVDCRSLYTCIMTMKSLERVSENTVSRLVFWFDS